MTATKARIPQILYLTRVYPYRPVFGGEIAYSRGVIESLAKACNLTVLAATNGIAPVRARDVDGVQWHLVPKSRRPSLLSLFTAMPNIIWRNATAAYRRELDRLLALAWDGIILDHIASAHVIGAISAWRRRHPEGRLLYVAHEHERTTRTEKYVSYGGNFMARALMRYDGWKIGRWEDRVLRSVDVISLINPHEQGLFEQHVRGKRYIATVPGYDGERQESRWIDARVPRRIAVLGGRGSLHKQNILRQWLAAAYGPLTAERIEIDVVGDVGPALLSELRAAYPAVRFSGFVEGLREHLQTARIGVVPDTVGRGVKVRLASYIFARVPLVGLENAIDGLPLVAGRDFREAPTLPQLAELCIRLIDDFEELNRLQQNAYRACDAALDWSDRARTIIAALTDGRPPAATARAWGRGRLIAAPPCEQVTS